MTILSLIELNKRIYLGTGLGLCIFDISLNSTNDEIYHITSYNKNQGFNTLDFNSKSSLSDYNNHLWWGVGDNLVIMSEPKKNKSTPKIKITYIELDNEKLNFINDDFIQKRLLENDTLWLSQIDTFYTRNNQNVNQEINQKKESIKWDSLVSNQFIPKGLVLPYNKNQISIYFSSNIINNVNKNSYSYILEGVNQEKWSSITNIPYASFTNLSPGEYNFKVRCRSFDGYWSEPEIFSFTITPPWWQTKIAYVGYIIMFFGIIFGYSSLRTKQLLKRQKLLEQTIVERTTEIVLQKEEIEKHRGMILESINYAQQIQESMLVEKKIIQSGLGEIFVIYKPKDIVSGDFYWYCRIENFSVIACVDCTGHGVPGAFMTMIGNLLLNNIVKKNNITDPGLILHHLHHNVVETLHQESAEKSQEGMDLSICTIDHTNMKMKFSGARNSIYVSNNNILTRYKAGMYPIGGIYFKKGIKIELTFESTEINLTTDSIVYMTTDGFADQFGGDKQECFNNNRLEALLKKANTLKIDEQGILINNEIEEWMGTNTQNDDILLLGFKIGV